MRNTSLILLIAGCILLRGIVYASVGSRAPQQSSGNSRASDAANHHSSDKERATVSSQRIDQKEPPAPPEHAGKRRVQGKISLHKRVSMNTTYRPKQVHQNREHAKPEDVTSTHKQVLTKPVGPASKVVKIHIRAVRPATGVAISGEHFRSGRNLNATLAVIGGAANTKRSTGAINGTEVSRRHLK